MNLTPPENIIISDADRRQCLGSGEIKPCPHCGRSANGEAIQNPQTKLFVYTVICSGLHECGTSTHCCSETLEDARSTAIAHWNKRMSENTLKAVREMISRFLVAHRDTHKSWIEAFVECGAITADFNYHPLYPFIEPKK